MKIASQKNSFLLDVPLAGCLTFLLMMSNKILMIIFDKVPDSILLLKGLLGEKSMHSVNHLLVGYPSGTGGFRDFFVSQYVAREVLRSGKSEAMKLAYGIARGLNNPSFTGWVVEMDFVQCLSNSVKNQIIVHGLSIEDDKWDVQGIVDFALAAIVSRKDFVLKYFWLHPLKWNQGGYDLVVLVY